MTLIKQTNPTPGQPNPPHRKPEPNLGSHPAGMHGDPTHEDGGEGLDEEEGEEVGGGEDGGHL